jgi:hypothetical protein
MCFFVITVTLSGLSHKGHCKQAEDNRLDGTHQEFKHVKNRGENRDCPKQ